MRIAVISFRPATPADIDDIAHLHAEGWERAYRGLFYDTFLDGDVIAERRAVWRRLFEEPPGGQHVTVACRQDAAGDDIVGFVCVYGAHDPTWGSFVDNLYVAKRASRQGLGKALMGQAADWLAKEHRDAGVYLWTWVENLGAIRLYEQLQGRSAEEAWLPNPGGGGCMNYRYVWPTPEALAAACQPLSTAPPGLS